MLILHLDNQAWKSKILVFQVLDFLVVAFNYIAQSSSVTDAQCCHKN